MPAWSLPARLSWLGVVLSATAAGALLFINSPVALEAPRGPEGLAQLLTAAGLGALAVLLGLRPIEPAPDRKLSAASAALIAAPLVLPVAWAALVAGAAVVVTQVAGRRRWYAAAFNVAQCVLAVTAAGVACYSIERTSGLPYVVPCAVAAGAYYLVNTGAVSGMSAARRGASWLREWVSLARTQWLAEVGLLTGGVLLAVHLVYAPLAVPLLVAPLWLATRVLADSAEIRRLNQTLTATLERQRRFLADASHELRTPVASLRAQLDVLGQQVEGPAAGAGGAGATGTAPSVSAAGVWSAVGQMAQETARMSGLLSDLLTLARADEGAPLARERVNLEDVLVACYREARPLARHVDFRLTLDGDAPDVLVVTGDSERLRQLFANLVTNALRFTPEGGRVEISCAVHGGNALVSVSDTGCGISPEALPRVFDRFYRADAGRARDRDAADGLGGSGLGLSIARWITEAHGGRISVRSEPGTGSTFTVTLPLDAGAPEPLRTAPRRPAPDLH